MKKSIIVIISMLIISIAGLNAQVKYTFTFQGVARDASGQIIANRLIALEVAIQTSPDGGAVYVERHVVTTSALGLFTLEIGAGSVVSGNFFAINWALYTYYLALAMDINGGTNFVALGVSQLLAVPLAAYANLAAKAESARSFDGEYLLVDTLDARKIYANNICVDTIRLMNPENGDSEYVLSWDNNNNFSSLDIDQVQTFHIYTDTIEAYRAFIDTISTGKLYADDICMSNVLSDLVIMKPRSGLFKYPSLNTKLEYTVKENIDFPGTPDLQLKENDKEFLRKNINYDDNFETYYKNILLRETFSDNNAKFSESRLSAPFYRCLKYYALPDMQNQEVPYLDGGSFYDVGTQQHAAYAALGVSPFAWIQTLTRNAQLSRYTYNSNVLFERSASPSQIADSGYNSSGMRMILIDYLLGCIQAYKIETMSPNIADGGTEYVFRVLAGTDASRYERGTSQLVNGQATVELTLPFCTTVNMESMTVQLTPLSADTYGLAVVEKTETGFVVKELASGTGNFQFDWEVKCVVKGEENFTVERPVETRGANSANQSDISKLADRVGQIIQNN